MSLILEALRKSEAERRRGQSPDLYGAAPLAASPRREGFRQWPVVAGGLLVLLAVAMLFWPQARQSTSATAPHAADVAEITATTETADATDAADAAEITDTANAAVPVRANAETATAQPGQAHAPVANAPAYPAAPDATAPIAAQHALRPVQAPVALPPPAPLPAPTTAAAPVVPPAELLPSLATLSTAERAALPPLKLSVHVWNSDPTQRFAIVDGQRIVQGAAIGNAVVAEIRRDGIVLDVNGQRVLLPRP